MKNLFLFLLVSLISVSASFSQERVNRSKISYSLEGEKITKATGWSFNSTSGEWVDYPNLINSNSKYKTEWKSLAGSYLQSRTKQNFNYIQMNKLVYNNNEIYVLLIDKWTGSYEYPTIRENWRQYKVTEAYIFSKSDYEKLKENKSKVEIVASFKMTSGGLYDKYDKQGLLDKIQAYLIKNDGELKYSTINEIFPVSISEEGLIRFYTPEYFSKYSNYDFAKEYFEIEKSEFDKLFID